MTTPVRQPAVSDLLVAALDPCSDPVEISIAAGVIAHVNPAWCTLFGLAREAVIGRTRRELGLRALERDRGSGWLSLRAVNGIALAVHYTRQLLGSPVGAPSAEVIVYQPLTSLLADANSVPLNPLPNPSRHPIAVTDAQGRILHANREFLQLTGYAEDEVADVGLPRILNGADRLLVALDRDRTLWSGNAIIRRKCGTPTTRRLSAAPLADSSGEPVAFVFQVSLEPVGAPALATNSAPSPDIGRLAHRMRNLLTVASMNVYLLESCVDGGGSVERLSLIKEAISSGLDILTRFDDLGRAEPSTS